MQFFFNIYVNKRSTDILWAFHIIINYIMEIIAFFYSSNTCFTSLHARIAFNTHRKCRGSSLSVFIHDSPAITEDHCKALESRPPDTGGNDPHHQGCPPPHQIRHTMPSSFTSTVWKPYVNLPENCNLNFIFALQWWTLFYRIL